MRGLLDELRSGLRGVGIEVIVLVAAMGLATVAAVVILAVT